MLMRSGPVFVRLVAMGLCVGVVRLSTREAEEGQQ